MSAPGLTVVALLARRTWSKTLARPVGLTFSLVQPLIWMLLFGSLMQRYPLHELPAEVSYHSFLVPGVCAMTLLFGASQSGVPWIRDLQSGFLERMLRTAAPRWAILVGKVCADVVRLLGQAAVVLAVGVALGAKVVVPVGPLLSTALILALFAFGFCSLSCFLALRAKTPETMATFVHLVNMPLVFTSTALVPARQMPGWLEGIAQFNPLSLLVDALRGTLLLGDQPALGPPVAALGVAAAALGWLAVREMRRVAG